MKLLPLILGLGLLVSPLHGESESKDQQQLTEPTKAGFVYVISNPKSFGEGVYKVGMTQRKNPATRIKELGDASVPFNFTTNILAKTDNPRGMEAFLHNELKEYRMNPGKEFFRCDLETIKQAITKYNETQK